MTAQIIEAFHGTAPTDHDAAKAMRVKRRPLVVRHVVVGAITYAAVSAHELLEAESISHRARPGHPNG